MDEFFIHYSAKPFTGPVRSVEQGKGRAGAFKPHGFWFSVEGNGHFGWKEWCEGNEYGLDHLAHQCEIVLKPDANVLRLRDAAGIDEFTATYGRCPLPDYPDMVTWEIDWTAVAAKYDGLIIAPCIWSRRLQPHTIWYNGWDCASGVIWNGDVVAEIKPL